MKVVSLPSIPWGAGLRKAVMLVFLAAVIAGCNTRTSTSVPADYAAQDVLLAHDSFEIPSKRLGGLRKVAVYLPPQYESEPSRHFPVLFFPDGGVTQDFPHVSHTIHRLIEKGVIAPMLVVGVESQDRYRELTTPAKGRRWKKKLPQAGGSAAYHEFFEQELKAEISKRYRIKDMPQALVGESLAGRWVVDGWTEHPERYDVWIAIDPSLWWNEKELSETLGARLKEANAHKGSKLYLSGAYLDKHGSLPDVHSFVEKLKVLGIGEKIVKFEGYPNLDHAEIFRATEGHIYEAMLGKWLSDPSR